MLNAIARLSGNAVRKTDNYLNGDGAKNPGKIKEIQHSYKASRKGLTPPDAKTKDELDKETLAWAKANGWDVPRSTK